MYTTTRVSRQLNGVGILRTRTNILKKTPVYLLYLLFLQGATGVGMRSLSREGETLRKLRV